MQESTDGATNWAERVRASIEGQQSILCVGLDPVWDKLPDRYKTGDVASGIYRYNCGIIDGAAQYAAAIKPQYKCYSAEGEAGIKALRMTCEYIKLEYPHIPIILDAKYADVGHVLERCAHEAFDFFGVDAVTAMPAPGRLALEPLFARPGKGCFMVVRTSNPGAGELQDIEVDGEPLYARIARQIAANWNDNGNVGLVGPATDPQVLGRIRLEAPDLPILCPGVGAQGGDLEAAVAAGLDASGGGLLINVSRAIMEASNPEAAANDWHGRLQEARAKVSGTGQRGEGNQTVNPLLAEVVLELFDIGAIKFEPVTLKSGLVSPYYNNLRIIASYPPLMRKVSALLAERMKQASLEPDVVIGIAEAGIPLAVGLSLHSGIPAGYVRSAAKAHGTKRMVEGAWKEGATAVLVDDVVSDGASKLEVLGHLQESGLNVRDILVVVDRGQGGVQIMERNGLRCHSVATMDDVLSILQGAGRIDASQVEEAHRFMREAQQAAIS